MNADYFLLMDEFPELFANPSIEKAIQIITDPELIQAAEQKLNTTIGIIYRDKYIILVKDLVVNPQGKQGTYIRILPATKTNGVVILPLIQDRAVFVRHFRHSTRRVHLEIPRGFSKEGVSVEENAATELLEETGYCIRSIELLGVVAPDTGLFSSQASIYAEYLEDEDRQDASDADEAICQIEIYALDAVKDMVARGEIVDGYTLSALALYWAKQG